VLAGFAKDFASFHASIRAGNHLIASRIAITAARGEHAQISHRTVSNHVFRHRKVRQWGRGLKGTGQSGRRPIADGMGRV
jgi:hypothetical protein